MRLAILATHPVQYQAPWFRHLARRMDVEVLYAHRQNGNGQAKAGFGVPFEWDTPLLEGYVLRWLRNVARSPGIDTFAGCDTPELAEVLRPTQFDAVLILGWNRKCHLQAAVACWRQGLPLLSRGDSHLRTPRSWARRLAKYVPYRLLLPRCAAHLYVGRANREYLRHYGVPDSRLFFSPHGVDNTVFAAEAERARAEGVDRALRSELGIGPTDFVVLFVGKLIEKKRPQDLISACGRIRATSSGRPVRAVVVGDGPLRGAVEAAAGPWSDRIRFVGFRNQSELPRWYAMADALALPSSEETWGMVVNEAMACGVPALVSDAVGCAEDLIENGRTGCVFSVGDVDGMTEGLVRLEALLRRDLEGVRRDLRARTADYSLESATKGLEEALEFVGQGRGLAGAGRSRAPVGNPA